MRTVEAIESGRAAEAREPGEASLPAGGAAVTPADLAELMASFTEVTSRLETTHAVLRGEVSRLTGELRDANERLRRSKRLAELGEMAAGIAHEIRNPLGSISLYSEMLTQDLRALDAAEPAETARKIGASVRRLDAIVRDVLDFARDLRVRIEPIDSEDLIESALHSERFDGATTPARVREVRIDRDAAVVHCDRSLGMQALLNVVENARQATGAGGQISMYATPCRVRTDARESVPGIAIGVRDEGPGIDDAVLGRMFNPFFTTRETGTGLGLAIVHRIVDAHGGSVVVRNNSDIDGDGGRGATVELRFPSVRTNGGGGALGDELSGTEQES